MTARYGDGLSPPIHSVDYGAWAMWFDYCLEQRAIRPSQRVVWTNRAVRAQVVMAGLKVKHWRHVLVGYLSEKDDSVPAIACNSVGCAVDVQPIRPGRKVRLIRHAGWWSHSYAVRRINQEAESGDLGMSNNLDGCLATPADFPDMEADVAWKYFFIISRNVDKEPILAATQSW